MSTRRRSDTAPPRSRAVRGRGGSPHRAPGGRADRRTPPARSGSRTGSTRIPDRRGLDPARDRGRARARRRRPKRSWRDAGDPRRRAITMLVVLASLFGIIALRLIWVQVVNADRYVAYGDDQRVANIELAADRGSIFDRRGYDLAVTLPQRTVVADPRLVTDPRGTARKLAVLLGQDEAEIYTQLTRDSAFSYIARRVSDEVADKIEAEALEGIRFVDEAKRINPAGDLARAVLGQVGVDNEGLSALELQYDRALSGSRGELVLERDPSGRTIPAGRHHLDPATPGDDLILSIDRNLQFEAERIMREAIASTESLGGTAILSNPETGEIYALVNLGGVDPETGQATQVGNMAVTANFEPGSVSKVVTMAAAIEEGLVAPDTVLRVPNALRVADHTFVDNHDHLVSDYTVSDILAKSSNVGTIMIAQQLGEQRLYDYLRDFGFGETTALDFPAEAAGAFPEPEDWSGTSIGTIPIGQGISVTAMQMLYAYNAIANDGVYVPPRLVGEIVDEDGERRPAPAGQSRRVVSQSTAAQVRDMMTGVVTEGTGAEAAIDGYEVAGKTGTARKPSPEGRGYVWPDGKTHHMATFAGFMPADDPKLSIIVVLDEPPSTYASFTAAPAFAELARHALRQLRLPPPVQPSDGTPELLVPPPLVRGQAAPEPESAVEEEPPPETTGDPSTTTTAPPVNATPLPAVPNVFDPAGPEPLFGGLLNEPVPQGAPPPARAQVRRQ